MLDKYDELTCSTSLVSSRCSLVMSSAAFQTGLANSVADPESGSGDFLTLNPE
jgi:hypothetical protein